jgi:hypothetical protein
LDGTGINVELALPKVFPFQKACHSVPVQDGYVVVQPTYVWANTSHYPLPVPIGGGDIATLAGLSFKGSNGQRTRSLYHP